MKNAHGIEHPDLMPVRTQPFTPSAVLVLWLIPLGGCQSEPQPEPVTTQRFYDDSLGLAGEIPLGWTHQKDGPRHLFSGPQQSDTYFTTVTLQPAGRAHAKLDDTLESAYQPVLGLRGFAWERREPSTVAGRPALRYGVTFELHENQRRKVGLLVATGQQVIDLSYGATTELYAVGLPAFELIAHSLSFY